MRNREDANDYVDFKETGARVYDMAANGREWTRDFIDFKNETVPLERKPRPDDRVIVRGNSFRNPDALLYQELKETTSWESKEYEKTSDDIGFRVVLEP